MVFGKLRRLFKRKDEFDIGEDFLTNPTVNNMNYSIQPPTQTIETPSITNDPLIRAPTKPEEQYFVTPPPMIEQYHPQIQQSNELEMLKQQILLLSSKIDNIMYKLDAIVQKLNMLENYLYYRR